MCSFSCNLKLFLLFKSGANVIVTSRSPAVIPGVKEVISGTITGIDYQVTMIIMMMMIFDNDDNSCADNKCSSSSNYYYENMIEIVLLSIIMIFFAHLTYATHTLHPFRHKRTQLIQKHNIHNIKPKYVLQHRY